MSRFLDQPLFAFLDALASAEPTPGGGTAAAMAGAMGASLLMMVAGLSKSRGGTEEERVALAEARASLASVRERLGALADTDAVAFNQVISAYRLPKNTDAEKAARKDAIQQGLKAATSAPLDTVRTAAEGVRLAQAVAHHGNRSASSDVAVGVGLLEAAAEGASANVRINLESIQDDAFRRAALDDMDKLMRAVASDAAAARGALEA
jgi:formiminotetrahydrofolate cyclodeaminase